MPKEIHTNWKKVLIEFFLLGALFFIASTLGGVVALRGFQPQLEYNDAMFLDKAAELYGEQHEYINGTYNCNNFSKDFKGLMGEFGYDIEIMTGWNNESGHAWTCASMEPQGVGFKDFRNIYPLKRKLRIE